MYPYPKQRKPSHSKGQPIAMELCNPYWRLHNGMSLTPGGVLIHWKLCHGFTPYRVRLEHYQCIIALLIIHQYCLYNILIVTLCVRLCGSHKYNRHLVMSLKFIQELARNGLRVFNIHDARAIAEHIGLKSGYVPRLLSRLSKDQYIIPLIKGTYAVSNTLLPGSPLHPYEIANGLIQPGAISCWSAMQFHKLTDQIIHNTFILTPYLEASKNSSAYSYIINGHEYTLIRVLPKNYWGITSTYIDTTKVYITDLERTLIDGFVRPRYCGGISEVITGVAAAAERIDVNRLFEYSQQSSHSVQQRLGWTLERLEVLSELQVQLRDQVKSFKTYAKLNPEGQNVGARNKVWKIMENM